MVPTIQCVRLAVTMRLYLSIVGPVDCKNKMFAHIHGWTWILGLHLCGRCARASFPLHSLRLPPRPVCQHSETQQHTTSTGCIEQSPSVPTLLESVSRTPNTRCSCIPSCPVLSCPDPFPRPCSVSVTYSSCQLPSQTLANTTRTLAPSQNPREPGTRSQQTRHLHGSRRHCHAIDSRIISFICRQPHQHHAQPRLRPCVPAASSSLSSLSICGLLTEVSQRQVQRASRCAASAYTRGRWLCPPSNPASAARELLRSLGTGRHPVIPPCWKTPGCHHKDLISETRSFR